MATILFELIAPEWVLFSGEARAVMPATEGDMTVMAGHEPTMVMLHPGIVAVTDVPGHGHRAFIRGGFAEITELTRDRLDEEMQRLETKRDARPPGRRILASAAWSR